MRYLLRLCPVESFFFGGEITFGDGINENYLVKSNPFPQQTTLLGAIRKELLIQRDYLTMKKDGYILDISRKTDIERLIGHESFDIAKDRQDFGVIRKLSPVFLCKSGLSGDKEFFISAPGDSGLEFDYIKGRSNLDKERDYIPVMKGYYPKELLMEGFLNVSSGETIIFDSVFIPVERVGITKGKGGVTGEKSFYKQTAYRLKEGFEFASIVEMEGLDVEFESALMLMGAEKSAFMISAEKNFQRSFEDIFSKAPSEKILLLSDAYVNEEIFASCKFAITKTISFRNIKSSTGDYRFRKEAKMHTLLKRGSVFFPGDGKDNEVKKMFDSPNLQAIGYNIIT